MIQIVNINAKNKQHYLIAAKVRGTQSHSESKHQGASSINFPL